jgi:DNA topoisomerase I
MDVLVVESPAKAKTIGKYLGPGYTVLASYGHVRDLPAKDGSVRPDEDFAMDWLVDPQSQKRLDAIAKAVTKGGKLYLATDPDREGEAISWHVRDVLKAKKALDGVDVKRVTFNAITKQSVLDAVAHPRELDQPLIDAYMARRALDYLVGFTLSPVLWRKLPGSRSAGRVQSVALRLICERESEIEVFKSREYWTVDVLFGTAKKQTLKARLTHLDGRKLDKFDLDTQERAEQAKREIERRAFSVASIDRRQVRRNPPPPFITSTLQQEASRKLGLGAATAMRVAQRLYEGVDIGGETVGLITYMRTDGVQLAPEAIGQTRRLIETKYGQSYLPTSPRVYTSKAKNAQEAHEAIRPTDLFRTPQDVAAYLDKDQRGLYELIWKRTVASQMESAVLDQVTVDIASGDKTVQLRATGSVVKFNGFLTLYDEGKDETGEDEEGNSILPDVTPDEALDRRDVLPEQHFTEPPPRYSEASLVKKLEELGIGRPSTYSSIIKTIQDRGYVHKKGSALVPSWVAFAVTGLLEQHFGRLVDYDFTAAMEDELDAIANGHEQRTNWLNQFYFGGDHGVEGSVARSGGLKKLVGGNLEGIDAREVNSIKLFDDEQGRPVCVRVGKNGPYLERYITGDDGEPTPQRANLNDTLTPDELTLEVAEEFFATPQEGRVLGVDPGTGHEIVAKDGRYGPYVTEILPEPPADPDEGAAVKKGKKPTGPKPRSGSLLRSMDLQTVTLEDALKLLLLPRVVGADPASGEEITAQNGRYGPYLKRGTDSRSLSNEDQMFTITLDEALKIYAEPKRSGRQSASAPPLRELGNDGASGKPMVIKDGRFGPYVTDGETNASLRKGDDVLSITDERASELLADRRARGPVKKTAKKTTRKAPAKKAAAKKAVKRS